MFPSLSSSGPTNSATAFSSFDISSLTGSSSTFLLLDDAASDSLSSAVLLFAADRSGASLFALAAAPSFTPPFASTPSPLPSASSPPFLSSFEGFFFAGRVGRAPKIRSPWAALVVEKSNSVSFSPDCALLKERVLSIVPPTAGFTRLSVLSNEFVRFPKSSDASNILNPSSVPTNDDTLRNLGTWSRVMVELPPGVSAPVRTLPSYSTLRYRLNSCARSDS
mmetsp:Transcript_6821/g.16738  ORF Transcript_6821/g.16738 Transcript_6821/m.16738 type:complete len:222 (+) Transcript_6821:216-881(+)